VGSEFKGFFRDGQTGVMPVVPVGGVATVSIDTGFCTSCQPDLSPCFYSPGCTLLLPVIDCASDDPSTSCVRDANGNVVGDGPTPGNIQLHVVGFVGIQMLNADDHRLYGRVVPATSDYCPSCLESDAIDDQILSSGVPSAFFVRIVR
jgi:hypothetical protein